MVGMLMHTREETAVLAGSVQEPGAASRDAFQDGSCGGEVGKSKSGLQERC